MAEKNKNNGGRPSKFDEKQLKAIELMAKRGFTDEEMAICLNITVRTFHNWKEKHKELFHSLKSWKDEADAKVERSLYERATGYSHPEDKIFNDNGKPLVVPTTKHYPPDPTSMIFWLKNRQSENWRDKTEKEVNEKVNISISYQKAEEEN